MIAHFGNLSFTLACEMSGGKTFYMRPDLREQSVVQSDNYMHGVV